MKPRGCRGRYLKIRPWYYIRTGPGPRRKERDAALAEDELGSGAWRELAPCDSCGQRGWHRCVNGAWLEEGEDLDARWPSYLARSGHCRHCPGPQDPLHDDPAWVIAEAECALYEDPAPPRVPVRGRKRSD